MHHRVANNPHLQLWLYIFCSILFSRILQNRLDFIAIIIDSSIINFVLSFAISILVPCDLSSFVIYIIILSDIMKHVVSFIGI